MNPFISISIPAYKNMAFLDVLLMSIESQVYKDFEVIITDDSPDNEVEQLCEGYKSKFRLTYYRNKPVLGSPANWNKAIELAKGEWVKIMHDDDWFTDKYSLAKFADAAKLNPTASFIFSGFSNYEQGKLKNVFIPTHAIQHKLRRSPLHLFAKNYIGHPSTTLIKNDLEEWYDEKIKWVVDFEFYIRVLKTHSFYSIELPLINIGLGNEQITKTAFRNIAIEIPENMYLLNKLGIPILKNIIAYDYFWRLLRNVGIRKLKDITAHYSGQEVPVEIKRMLAFQRLFPLQMLKIGLVSKSLMFFSYLYNYVVN